MIRKRGHFFGVDLDEGDFFRTIVFVLSLTILLSLFDAIFFVLLEYFSGYKITD
jgi:hypothetical protein